jgi:hypothetical protein
MSKEQLLKDINRNSAGLSKVYGGARPKSVWEVLLKTAPAVKK